MAGIFKAYDIRGTYPNELHESLAARIGAATVSVLSAKRIVIGRDMRQSGPSIRAALIDAVLASGCDVIDIGEVGTPTLYYAVASLSADAGIMIRSVFTLSKISSTSSWEMARSVSTSKAR